MSNENPFGGNNNPFAALGGGGGGMGDMLGGLMQQAMGMKQKMEQAQAEAATREVEGTAGGGRVTVRMNGGMEVLAVRFDERIELDRELLEDLVTVAVNDAIRKARGVMSEAVGDATGGMNLPGLDGLLG